MKKIDKIGKKNMIDLTQSASGASHESERKVTNNTANFWMLREINKIESLFLKAVASFFYILAIIATAGLLLGFESLSEAPPSPPSSPSSPRFVIPPAGSRDWRLE